MWVGNDDFIGCSPVRHVLSPPRMAAAREIPDSGLCLPLMHLRTRMRSTNSPDLPCRLGSGYLGNVAPVSPSLHPTVLQGLKRNSVEERTQQKYRELNVEISGYRSKSESDYQRVNLELEQCRRPAACTTAIDDNRDRGP
jgi:hypothetical protein